MSHVHDCILEVTGGPTIKEGELAYYQANGATSNQIADAEREFLIAQGVTGRGHNQDMWMEYWDLIGVPGDAYADRWRNYWCGTLGPTLVSNGDFANWTADDPDGWFVDGEVGPGQEVTEDPLGARIVSDGTLISLYQGITCAGLTVQLDVEVTEYLSGLVVAGSTSNGSDIGQLSSQKHYVFKYVAIGDWISFKRGSICDMVINNVSVRELTTYTL